MSTPSANRTAERPPRAARRASRNLATTPAQDAAVWPVASAEESTAAQERDAFSTLDLAQTRADALAAMRRAAQWLSIDACALSTDAYRAFRETETSLRTPSPITISVLFGGWQRAREHVAMSQYDDAAVEEETIRAIYGDPACRHRAYGTTNARVPKDLP